MDVKPLRILVAEAEPTVADTIRAFLELPSDELLAPNVSPEVVCVQSREAAQQLLESLTFEVVLLDLNLDDSLGLSTYYQTRAHLHGVAVVVLTSHEEQHVASQTLDAGAHHLLLKHRLDRRTLLGAVRYAMERNRRERAEFELKTAGIFQASILAADRPHVQGVDIAADCHPACTLAGDFYDFVTLADGKLGIVLGDVSGHGLGPAILTAEARGIFRSLAKSESDPGCILTEVNRLISTDCVNSAFITVFLAVICPDTHTLQYGTAGHEGYLLNAHHEPKRHLRGSSPPLGVFPEQQFVTADMCDLAPDDVIFACTDGLLDCYSPQRQSCFGMQGVISSLKRTKGSASEMIDDLFRSVGEFSDVSQDDMTALVVRMAEL